MIDGMTLFEVEELLSYWAEHPPLHIALAALWRGGRRTAAAPQGVDAALAALGPGFAARNVQEGLPPVTLDFAQLKRRTEGETPPSPFPLPPAGGEG